MKRCQAYKAVFYAPKFMLMPCLPFIKRSKYVALLFFSMQPIAGFTQIKNADELKPISLTDQLSNLYNISKLPLYDNAVSGQTSTYDRAGGNDDGFNGTYSFIKRNPDSSVVMFEATGSGVITRIATPTPTNDTLYIYIDDTLKPVLSIRYIDLFSGKIFPFTKPVCGNQLGGFYCYYPIMFNKVCKIVCRAKSLQFHQIQYKLYPNGTAVKSFSPHLDAGETQALQKVVGLWQDTNHSISNIAPNPLKKTLLADLKPGETTTIFNFEGGGRILGMEFGNADEFSGKFKDVDIKITWDDDATPAVYCPLADFFGYAFGTPSMQSLLLGTKNNKNYCYYPMPFNSKATIQLIYRKSDHTQAVKRIEATIYYSTEKRNIQKEGKFYVCWHGNSIPPAGQPSVFLNTNGKGHYVGTLLQAQGLRPGMTIFFEGDDSTVVDGEQAIHGTGSEDYFNGGWYAFPDRWSSKFSLPLHGSLEYSLPYCRTGGYRLYLDDKISFKKSIYQSMEHGPEGNKIPAGYTSLSFYYCDTPPTVYTKPTDELATTDIADTLMLYPQLLDFNVWGEAAVKPVWEYNTGGESFIFTVKDESRIKFALKDILPGRYKIFADLVKYPDGCSFSVWQQQSQVSDWIATNQNTKERAEQEFLGYIDLTDFQNTVTLKFKSNNSNDKLFLNRFILVKQ